MAMSVGQAVSAARQKMDERSARAKAGYKARSAKAWAKGNRNRNVSGSFRPGGGG